jgi:hypothetical protein
VYYIPSLNKSKMKLTSIDGTSTNDQLVENFGTNNLLHIKNMLSDGDFWNKNMVTDIFLLTVPRPKAECVTKRETMEENNSGDDAPAAISVAPEA